MDSISESKLVYAAVTGCVVMSQIYFLTKYQGVNKVHLVKLPQKPAQASEVSQVFGSDEIRERRNQRGSQWQIVDETLMKDKSRLPDLDRSLKLFYAISVIVNICLTLKYFVLCLLDSELMRDYRYLDCVLLGRLTINGRTTGLTKYVGLCLPLFQLGWRFTMLYLRPKFNFIYMEFLLQNPKELIAWEAETKRRSKLSTGSPDAYSNIGHSTKASKRKEAGSNEINSDQARHYSSSQGEWEHKHSTLLTYMNPFVAAISLDGANANFSRLRPNRTFRAWAWVSQVLLIYIVIMLGPGVIGFLPALRMCLPLLLTRPGFRLNYHNCIEWISRQPNKQEYAFIDTINQNETEAALSMASVLMPFDDYIEFNLYHSIRLGVDICENLFIFFEVCMSFVIYTLVAIICALDMYLYTEEINKRVQRMIRVLTSNERLDERQHDGRNLPRLAFLAEDGARGSSLFNTGFRHDKQLDIDNDYRAQILDIQAMIVDMFALIDTYNPYAAFFAMYTITIWIVYSAVCSVPWLFVPLMAESSKLEWYLFEAITTLFFFIIIGSLNAVRRSTSRLYRSLSTLATLDYTRIWDRSDRWLGLLKHFTPIPLNCFTIFRTSEISWLLGLKMFAWLASALVVISSFLVRSVSRTD